MPITRWHIATLALGAVCVLIPRPASANPELDQARKAIEELDYEVASSHLDRALRLGDNTPAEMQEIMRLSGEIQAALGNDKAAEHHFFAMLTFAPLSELPTGSSPKLTAPFARAKKRIQTTGGLSARCEFDARGPAIAVYIDADPAHLVAGARAVYRLPSTGRDPAPATDTTQTVEARGDSPIRLVLPDVDGLAVHCAIIDQRGNRLIEIGSADAPLAVHSRKPRPDVDRLPTTSRTRRQPLFAHWVTWGVVSAAAAGAGTYFGLETRSDQRALDELNRDSGAHEFAEAQAVADRGRRNALVTNVSFAVAGACAVVSVVQFLRRPGSPPDTEPSSVIAPTPVPGGAGISITTNF